MTWFQRFPVRAGGFLLIGVLAGSGALGDERQGVPVQDRGKAAVERSGKSLLARTGPEASANPKVAPGKVRWHADFAAACTAAGKSGKPVLLFHLMGKLDDRFC